MHTAGSLLALLLFHALSSFAQNLPDRVVVLDPLGDTTVGRGGFIPLPGTRLYGEFARYSDGSGSDHRWNAKMGGYLEFARWDSTWSIALMGTMEVIMDPQNDISFNPRAIFWEEGALASARLGTHSALQFGYMHRCKHDIDNLDILDVRNERQKRTLIYSGIVTRWLNRPRPLIEGSWNLYGGFSVRNDLFVHLLDDSKEEYSPNLSTLLDAVTLTGRLDLRRPEARWGMHLNGSLMVSLYGGEEGIFDRFSDVRAFVEAPFLELGADVFNPNGMSFTLFGRGEWQRDGGIRAQPLSEKLFLIGVRAAGFGGMW